MAARSLGVDTGSTGDIWATQNKAKYKFADIRRYEGLSPAMLDLAAGRIDGYISDIPALQYYVKDKPALQSRRAHPDRRAILDHVRQEQPARREGQRRDHRAEEGRLIAKIHENWFGAKPEPTSTTVKVMDMPKL